jgi:DNA-binding NarL/FixJ family response regulator
MTQQELVVVTKSFRISPRETQVLILILNGKTLNQIALELCITSSTVQDHIKNMLIKTETHTRTELIVKLFGWG